MNKGLLSAFVFLMLAGPTPAHPGTIAVADPRTYLGLVIQHVGAEDRSVTPLILFVPGAEQELRQDFPQYGREFEWLPVPATAFESLSETLAKEFFTQAPSNDDLTKPGSYLFVLLGASGAKGLRLDPQHSSVLFTRALGLLPSGPATAALQKRLAITRI